jgi:hypothetical protein
MTADPARLALAHALGDIQDAGRLLKRLPDTAGLVDRLRAIAKEIGARLDGMPLQENLPAAREPRADREQEALEFGHFWRAYPVKIGRGDAEKAWGRTHRQRPPTAELLMILEDQKRSERWRAGTVPNPATWLNQGRWGDDPSTMSAVNGNGRQQTESEMRRQAGAHKAQQPSPAYHRYEPGKGG